MAVSSLLSACAGIPKPNTDLCIVNAPQERRKCYNMAKDYDDQGKLKPGSVPVYRDNKTVGDLNKFLVIDGPEGTVKGQTELTTFLQRLRQHYANCQSGQ